LIVPGMILADGSTPAFYRSPTTKNPYIRAVVSAWGLQDRTRRRGITRSSEASLEWLAKIDFNNQHPTEKRILQRYKLFLQTMRNIQFKQGTLSLPPELLEKLCLFLNGKGLQDELSSYYLGQYYLKFKKSRSHAIHYFTQTLQLTEGKEEFSRIHNSVEKIIKTLQKEK